MTNDPRIPSIRNNMPDVNPSDADISEIIALAWADDVSFEEIKQRYGISEKEVIRLMRGHLKRSSFKLWRERVSGRITKHRKLLKIKQRIQFDVS